MKMLKRTLALMLALIMMFSAVPFNAYATESTDEPSTPTEAPVDAPEAPSEDEVVPEDEEVPEVVEEEPIATYVTRASTGEFQRILHLDNGRKYFSVDWIKALITEMKAAGFTHLQLAFGNDGMRFLLDDMSVGSYSDDDVTAAVQAGNEAYYDAGDKNELTQAEMDEIIAHANAKGIEIIPLFNNPGHMDTMISAMTTLGMSPSYNGSNGTIDLEDTTAVAFMKALLQKYVTYFAGKGCTVFNMGADEYANDIYSSGAMGFGELVSNGDYQLFVDYVNALNAMVKAAGMKTMVFNDGIYFQNQTSYKFDTDLMIAFWSSGWGTSTAIGRYGAYKSASASTMASMGHPMVNTNGDYYFVLKNDGTIQNPSSTALDFDNTVFMGSTVSDPAGSMFCIWCDKPGLATEQEVAAAVRITLRKMAASMNNTDSYSDAVVSGGFNADGTLNVVVTPDPEPEVPVEPEKPETVTKTDETTKVAVTAPGLSGLTVTAVEEADLPVVPGAAEGKVLAWDMTPATAEGKYEGEATVAVPVPEGWDSSKMGAFVIEADNSVKLIDGAVNADGNFEFTMPHFSVGGTYEVAPIAATPENITLEIGGTQEYTLDGLVGTEGTYTTTNGVASYTIVHHTETTPAGTTVSEVSSVAAGNYILGNGTNSWITLNNGSVGTTSDPTNATEFTIAASGSGWTIKSGSYYLTVGGGFGNRKLSTSESEATWSYDNGFYQTFSNRFNYYLLSDATVSLYPDDSDIAKLYTRTIGTGSSTKTTTIIFTALTAGSTTVSVGSNVYNVTVNKDAISDTITVNTSKTYTDSSASAPVVADSTVATATLNNGTLTITGIKVGTTTVTTDNAVYTISVSELDLSTVSPLTAEFWITNQVVTINGVTSKTIAASDVYGEAGVAFKELVPTTDGAATKAHILWKGYLLPNGYHQEDDTSGGQDMTTNENGTRIYKIRYWDNGSGTLTWQYYDGSAWVSIESTDQVVAYYMQQTEVTTEVSTNVVDWAQDYAEWKAGVDNGWFWDGYVESGTKFIFLDFAVVYQDGTQNPSSFPNDNTWFLHFDGHSASNPRTLKPIYFTERNNYEIWKVTVTDGTCSGYYSANSFASRYDNSSETVVWSEDMGGEPVLDDITYTANRSGKLIRVYVRTVATEDSLTVVYYDEKFGDTLFSYNINVPANKNFSNNMYGTPSTMENGRINVTGCGIVNTLNVKQEFQTDLTKVPEAVGKYDSELYSYTGSEISEDGKTLYLYYNINTKVLKPNFVVDFGLPITFNLSDVTNTPDLVKSVTASARYGTVSYNSSAKTFTYTPTKVLQNVDVLSITLTFEGRTVTTSLTNVGVTPATSVYYEEDFLLNNATGWTKTSASLGNQETAVLGARKSDSSINHYGYDGAYAGKGTSTGYITGAAGASTSFTFTGTGFQLYGNSANNSGFVTVYSQGELSKLYMINTALTPGSSNATNQQKDNTYYSLPFISETDLPHGTYTVQIKQTNGDDAIYLDGVRVLNTINEEDKASADSIYRADLEDKPDFYELRDYVLNAIDVEKLEDSQYTDTADRVLLVDKVSEMAGQVYNALGDSEKAVVINKDGTTFTAGQAQDLLDNGPKNELYLYPGQTLAFSVTTDRVVQLGLKAPTGSSKFTLTVDNKVLDLNSLSTTVDMFYKIAEKGGTTHTVSITVTDGVLSTTLLKVCDDPNFTFNALTQEDIENTLLGVYGLTDVDTPVEPEVPETPVEPEVPEETTKPTEPEVEETTKPSKPNKPSKPEKPGKPENTKPTEPQKPGKPGNNGNQKPGKDEEKTYTLKITFVSLFGKKVGTATITTTNGMVSASQIAGKAPARYKALWFIPVTLRANGNNSIVVPVI